nr:ATP synthase F0 subunit 8 [Eusudasina nantouensis]WQB38481.1 ATP synthase F0 subunit 8 [Eusudasina nantouensis]
MPQMSPMNWAMLMIYTTLTMYQIMSLTYFNSTKFKKKNNN